MAISSGRSSITIEEILKEVCEADILHYYLGVSSVPTIINSPLREDKHPSFGLYSIDGVRIFYKDLANKDRGGLFDLLSIMWGCSFGDTLERIYKELPKFKQSTNIKNYVPKCKITNTVVYNSTTNLECKIRDWEKHDIDYWESFGISLEWLKYAEVYPISHKIVVKDNHRYVFGADKYAYTYVEHKENKVTLKIYQPFNKNGYKWSNKHDNSVLSLWTKIPLEGDLLCICSSLKDALCLWANTGIPAIAVQGEGYSISNTAVEQLKQRFKNIYILFDNDAAGLYDGEKLAEATGFTNLVLPNINETKDISDLYFSLQNKEQFNHIILQIFKK